MRKNWVVPPLLSTDADKDLSLFHPVLRQLLYNRGIANREAASRFLQAEVEFDTDPYLLAGMQATVDRVHFGIEHRETIAVYGDYDVDGVTSTALLVQILQSLGATVRSHIPNRFEEGYGLNREALDSLKADGVTLVVTVDCGIRSPDEATYARDIGLDLIVTDHHHPLDGSLPPAFAIICPKQALDTYPEKNLAGVGIAYKIAQGLTERRHWLPGTQALLDLVALGTVADLAPLLGENRMLVRLGLEEIRRTTRQGLFSLANVAGLSIAKTTASQIGFVLGPRLNAAGRLDTARAALELLVTTDTMRAGQLAQQLDTQNRQRQTLTCEIQERAETIATAGESDPILLFAVDEDFNPGVVGLAASRLAETHYRPAVVAARGSEETRGSCRSIPEFHITDALDRCSDLLVRHGGHAAAAGFTVRNENLKELNLRLKALAAEQLGSLDLRPVLRADMEISLSDLSFDLLRRLADLEPTGYGNPEAVFISRAARVKSARAVGAEGRHLKLTLEDERGASLDAIGFRLGPELKDLPNQVDIAYALEANEYRGRTTLQLNLKDIKPSQGA